MLTLKMLTYAEYAALFRVSQALKSLLLYNFGVLKGDFCVMLTLKILTYIKYATIAH